MKKTLILGVWLLVTPIILLSALFLNQQISKTKNFSTAIYSSADFISSQTTPYKMFTALPGQIGGVVQAIEANDARTLIVENFLKVYDSPLAPYAQFMVVTADKYDLDFRLLPAIAIKESAGGRVMPQNSYNAWGWAIHEAYTKKFPNWNEAIETVASGLRQDYLNYGLITPEQIMAKYTPASLAKGGPWAKDVRKYFSEME